MRVLGTPVRIRLNNILFATDFSRAAAAAMPFAAKLATRFGAKLFALHVRTPVINPMTPPAGWPALEKAAAEGERIQKDTLRYATPGIEPVVLVEEGGLLENLMAVIEKRNIDLLVLGTHGCSGIGKFVFGSAAEDIFRSVSCPVLTVGPHASEQVGKDGEFTRILYATSFTSKSADAARYAISLAQEFQARMTLMHVLEDTQAGDLVVPQDLFEASRTHLAHLVPPEAELWFAPEYAIERGDVAEKILQVARKHKADLIVMGAHRPGGIPGAASHLPIATAHKVITHAACAVLTIGS